MITDLWVIRFSSLFPCLQIGHYHGVMTSMLGLGQLSTVITQVNGVLASK